MYKINKPGVAKPFVIIQNDSGDNLNMTMYGHRNNEFPFEVSSFTYTYDDEGTSTCDIVFQFDNIQALNNTNFKKDQVLWVTWGFLSEDNELAVVPRTKKVRIIETKRIYSEGEIRIQLSTAAQGFFGKYTPLKKTDKSRTLEELRMSFMEFLESVALYPIDRMGYKGVNNNKDNILWVVRSDPNNQKNDLRQGFKTTLELITWVKSQVIKFYNIETKERRLKDDPIDNVNVLDKALYQVVDKKAKVPMYIPRYTKLETKLKPAIYAEDILTMKLELSIKDMADLLKFYNAQEVKENLIIRRKPLDYNEQVSQVVYTEPGKHYDYFLKREYNAEVRGVGRYVRFDEGAPFFTWVDDPTNSANGLFDGGVWFNPTDSMEDVLEKHVEQAVSKPVRKSYDSDEIILSEAEIDFSGDAYTTYTYADEPGNVISFTSTVQKDISQLLRTVGIDTREKEQILIDYMNLDDKLAIMFTNLGVPGLNYNDEKLIQIFEDFITGNVSDDKLWGEIIYSLEPDPYRKQESGREVKSPTQDPLLTPLEPARDGTGRNFDRTMANYQYYPTTTKFSYEVRPGEEKELAQNVYRAILDGMDLIHTGNLSILGDPWLRDKMLIELKNVADEDTGKWYIKKCVHRISPSEGYITNLEITKDPGKKKQNLIRTIKQKIKKELKPVDTTKKFGGLEVLSAGSANVNIVNKTKNINYQNTGSTHETSDVIQK